MESSVYGESHQMDNHLVGGVDRSGSGMLDALASHCSRFSRRSDLNVFNMSDYSSCENCKHNNGDNQCVANKNLPLGMF